MPVLKRKPIVMREFSIMPDGKFDHGTKRGATPVSLCFFQPRRKAASFYGCAYEIRKDDKLVHRFAVAGIDAVSALRNAMRDVVMILEIRFLNEWRVSVPKEYLDDMRGS